MKKGLHPTYYPKAKVTCACGNTFTVGSTLKTLEIEICSACHPFYTGQGKIVDKMGQVQKFKERLAKKQPASKKTKPSSTKKPVAAKSSGKAKSAPAKASSKQEK